MSSREEPQSLLSVKGEEQGNVHVWEQEMTLSSKSAWNFSESKRSNPAWPWGWTCLLNSQKPKKKDEEDRHFFSPTLKKNDTQKASCTFFPYCLSLKSGEREMDAKDTRHVTKKDVSLNKT